MNLDQYKVLPQDKETKGVVSAPNRPSGTPRQNKAIFDNLVGFLVDKYNGLLAVVQKTLTAQENTNADFAKKITDAVDTSKRAEATANKAESNINLAVNTANSALTVANGIASTAQRALDTSVLAQQKANEANTIAGGALTTANNAFKIASEIAATAEDALFTASEAKVLAQSVAFVYDPVTGLYTSVSNALQSIYDLVKFAPMTAQNFADNAIRVDFIRSKNMTVTELAVRGKQILLGG